MTTNMLVPVKTRMCIVCGKTGVVTMSATSVERWQKGSLIQEAAPSLTPGQREQLITGTHPLCWDMLFAGEEEE